MQEAVRRGVEGGAAGGGVGVAGPFGRAIDTTVAATRGVPVVEDIFGADEASKQMGLRAKIDNMTQADVMRVLSGFPGTTTDFEYRVAEKPIPKAGSPIEVWEEYWDYVLNAYGSDLYASSQMGSTPFGEFESEAEAQDFVRQAMGRINSERQSMNPDRQMDQYLEEDSEAVLDQYRP